MGHNLHEKLKLLHDELDQVDYVIATNDKSLRKL